jgi:hypothetical protein
MEVQRNLVQGLDLGATLLATPKSGLGLQEDITNW